MNQPTGHAAIAWSEIDTTNYPVVAKRTFGNSLFVAAEPLLIVSEFAWTDVHGAISGAGYL